MKLIKFSQIKLSKDSMIKLGPLIPIQHTPLLLLIKKLTQNITTVSRLLRNPPHKTIEAIKNSKVGKIWISGISLCTIYIDNNKQNKKSTSPLKNKLCKDNFDNECNRPFEKTKIKSLSDRSNPSEWPRLNFLKKSNNSTKNRKKDSFRSTENIETKLLMISETKPVKK